MEDVKIPGVLEEGKEYLLSGFSYSGGYYRNMPMHIKCIRSTKTAYLIKNKYRGKANKNTSEWYNKESTTFTIQEYL